MSSGSLLMSALVRHYEELVHHVRRQPAARWHDRGHAREIVHEVCAELLATPPRTSPLQPLAFLRTVCTRRAIDRLRQDQRHAAWVDSVEVLPEIEAPAADPARLLDARQRLAVLVDVIQALPPRCRDVFTMHRIHHIGQDEIARHLGITPKTVDKHLRLGTASCRRLLAEVLHEAPR